MRARGVPLHSCSWPHPSVFTAILGRTLPSSRLFLAAPFRLHGYSWPHPSVFRRIRSHLLLSGAPAAAPRCRLPAAASSPISSHPHVRWSRISCIRRHTLSLSRIGTCGTCRRVHTYSRGMMQHGAARCWAERLALNFTLSTSSTPARSTCDLVIISSYACSMH
eukprot:scaffold13090_cov122-Isochrysis_galbana.AAC.4